MAVHPQTSGGDAEAVFELKAAGFTLPILRLFSGDMDEIAAQLALKVSQAPDFFHNTPIVIDLSACNGNAIKFPLLVGLLRGYGMIPFGIRGGDKSQQAAAEAMELAILGDSLLRKGRTAAAREDESPLNATAESPAADEASGESGPVLASGLGPHAPQPGAAGSRFILVTRPVRSGQRFYAAQGDLSVVGSVSSGAELMADGNIHVYGPLRGRALAGMQGNLEARIFCQDLQAELVAIAGHYRVSENIPPELQGMPVQIFLDHKILRIEKL